MALLGAIWTRLYVQQETFQTDTATRGHHPAGEYGKGTPGEEEEVGEGKLLSRRYCLAVRWESLDQRAPNRWRSLESFIAIGFVLPMANKCQIQFCGVYDISRLKMAKNILFGLYSK